MVAYNCNPSYLGWQFKHSLGKKLVRSHLKKKKKKVWHGGVHLQSFVIRATQELWIAGSQLRPAQAKVRAYQKNNLKHKELEAWLK
jgi:hypothetical protein